MVWSNAAGTAAATLSVTASPVGTGRLVATWGTRSADAVATVTGTLGGRPVVVDVLAP